MATSAFSCPFCNHAFAAEAATGRVACPRCGELQSLREAAASADAVPVATEHHTRAYGKNPLVAPVALVVGIAFACVGAFLLLRSPKPDTSPPEWVPPPKEVATAPIELRGFAHLPSRPNIVFAVQPGPLLAYAERTKQDPVALLTRNRVPAALLGTLAKAGITLQHIDHLVGGVYVPDKNEEIRFGFVLVLRQKLTDEKAFLESLKAVPAPNLGQGRSIVDIGSLALHAFHASETVWVFSLQEKDVASPAPLAPELRTLIEERVPKDAAIWAAAAGERWHEKPLALLLGKDVAARLSQGRAAAFGYSFSDPPTLRVAVRTTDAAGAEQLRRKFRELATGEFSIAAGSEDWAELTRPIEPADAAATVKRMLE
jgi:hypothetical protein